MHTPAHDLNRRSWPLIDRLESADTTMPHANAVVVLAAASVELAALLAASERMTVFGDGGLRLVCYAGAIGGAFVSALAWPKRKDDPPTTYKQLLAHFVCSAVAGAIVTPAWFRYWQWSIDIDSVLFVSGAIAFFIVGLLKLVIPVAMRAVERRAEREAARINGDELSK